MRMAAKAVVVQDQNGIGVPNAEPSIVLLGSSGVMEYVLPLTNQDGYSLATMPLGAFTGYLKVVANGSRQYLQLVTLDNNNQEIHCSNNVWGPPNTINLPPLSF